MFGLLVCGQCITSQLIEINTFWINVPVTSLSIFKSNVYIFLHKILHLKAT